MSDLHFESWDFLQELFNRRQMRGHSCDDLIVVMLLKVRIGIGVEPPDKEKQET